MGHDLIGRAGDVVAARGREVAERGDDGHMVLALEAYDLGVQLVARRDAPAGAVDAQHERPDAAVLRRLLELGLDPGDRRLLLDQPEGMPRRQLRDRTGDVDEEHFVVPLALDRRFLERPRVLQHADRIPDDDETAGRPEGQNGEREDSLHRRGAVARPPRASRGRSRSRSISSRGRTRSSSRICRMGTSRAMAFLNSSAARS